jgi:hypothetical protein
MVGSIVKLKMWIGNLDGVRSGLIITTTKTRAMELIGTNRNDFESYWTLQPGIDKTLEPNVLYTRNYQHQNETQWQRGRYPV